MAKRNAALAAAALVYAVTGMASAATITSLVGDKDGFGGASASAVPHGESLPTHYSNRDAGDPAFHDAWGFEYLGGDFASPLNFRHDYAMAGTPVAATFFINVQGMSDNGGPWELRFNGVRLGAVANSGSTMAELFGYDVPVGLLTGSDVIELIYADVALEGYAINFSELVIRAASAPVPAPAAMPLLLGGLAALMRLRRIRA